METAINGSARRGWSFAARLLALLVLLGLGGFMLFCNVGEYHIVDYDEARHGINAYEMIRNNDYLVHTYAGEPDLWNLKPPLSFWSIALGYKLFGYTPFAMRFFSALATLLSIAAVTCWAWRRLGYASALIAVAFFVCTEGLYRDHFARFGDADSLYQLFFTLSMLCMLKSRGDFRWFYGSALFFALAFLQKSMHAMVIPAICFLYILLTGRIRELNWKRILLLLAYGFVPILIWAAARYSRDGMAFFSNMLSEDVVNRLGNTARDFITPSQSIPDTLWYYVGLFLPARTPLYIALAVIGISALVCLLRRARLSRELLDTLTGVVLWLLVPIAVFTIARVQFSWYIFSVYAAMPVLMAVCARAVSDSGISRRWVFAGIGVTIVVLLITIYPSFMRIVNMDDISDYQEIITDTLDRDYDSETHMYIQYNEQKNGDPIVEWMPAHMLAALYAGDVVCLDGGAEAYYEDEEPAILLIAGRENIVVIYDALSFSMLRREYDNLYILEK